MPHLTRCHLDGPSVSARALLDASAPDHDRETPLARGFSHQFFVSVAAGTSELMIEMSDH
jgi:hypothetical protein